MATVTRATFSSDHTTYESLASAPASGTAVIASRAFNPGSFSLDGTTTPAVTKFAGSTPTQASGGGTKTFSLDLTAIAGTEGNVDGTGLKVTRLRLLNPNANPVTLQAAASNGYLILGTSGLAVVRAGTTSHPGMLDIDLYTGGPTIGGSAKALELVGTSLDAYKLEIWMG
jgi:hypothetical protein